MGLVEFELPDGLAFVERLRGSKSRHKNLTNCDLVAARWERQIYITTS